jgi:hypothetical protein
MSMPVRNAEQTRQNVCSVRDLSPAMKGMSSGLLKKLTPDSSLVGVTPAALRNNRCVDGTPESGNGESLYPTELSGSSRTGGPATLWRCTREHRLAHHLCKLFFTRSKVIFAQNFRRLASEAIVLPCIPRGQSEPGVSPLAHVRDVVTALISSTWFLLQFRRITILGVPFRQPNAMKSGSYCC